MNKLKNRWRALWNPDMYQGWGKKDNYFEGWYFKWVDPKEEYALAVIPGISMGSDGKKHAFIQVFDGLACKASYHEFEADDFQPESDKFGLHLGGNYFSATKVKLDLPDLKGELELKNLHRWPKMLGAPGIMGWYSFVPFMECYHGIVSMHHQLAGFMNLNGQAIDFDGGVGYGEKDWGVSFPSAWIWAQSNHFGREEPICLMASVANIPWLGSSFVGFIVGFLFEGTLYRFATYTGAKMKAEVEGNNLRIAFKNKKHTLHMLAKPAQGVELVSPISGNMAGKVNESLQAELEVRFMEGEQELFSGTGTSAGLEIAGMLDTLLSQNWKR